MKNATAITARLTELQESFVEMEIEKDLFGEFDAAEFVNVVDEINVLNHFLPTISDGKLTEGEVKLYFNAHKEDFSSSLVKRVTKWLVK